MLILEGANDKLQLVTDAAVTVDVIATHIDCNNASPPVPEPPATTLTAITTAATTDIVAAPGANQFRNVKTIHIRNKHASSSVNITVVFDRSATDYEIHKVNLKAGEALEYIEGIGWFTLAGVVDDLGLLRVKQLTANQSNSTTTLTEVTGLTMPNVGPGTYNFRYDVLYQAAAATTGVRFSVNHDGTVTAFVANIRFGAGTTASSDAPDQDLVANGAQVMSCFTARAKSTTGWGTTVSVDTANADMYTIIEGLMVVTVEGNLELWHGSEVAASSTVKAGSTLTLRKAA